MRTPSAKAKSDPTLQPAIAATLKLWRRHRLTYDQTRYVAQEVRRALELERPRTRQRVIERLPREEERRLIDMAYRLPGTRGVLVKTLFQTGVRVSEFVNLRVQDVYFDELMILITPRLVQPVAAGSLAAVGDNYLRPSDLDLFLYGRVEAPGSSMPQQVGADGSNILAVQSAGGIDGAYGHIIK